MGNRGGCFHNADKSLKSTHWKTRQWIICVLNFKGRKRALMQPGNYTELFFLDEATALAGGHRPCFECQREKATAFRNALIAAGIFSERPLVRQMDERIAGEIQDRLKGSGEPEKVRPKDLPDGAFYSCGNAAFLKWKGGAFRWSFAGYSTKSQLHETGYRLTPRVTCEALRHGYSPVIHMSLQ